MRSPLVGRRDNRRVSCGRLLVAEQGSDGVLHFAVVAIREHEFALAVDEVVIGETIDVVGLGELAILIHGDGVGDLLGVHDLFHFLRAFGMADADDHDVLGVFFGEFVSVGDAGEAGSAPSGPEVEHDDLALEVGEFERLGVRPVLEIDLVGRGAPDLGEAFALLGRTLGEGREIGGMGGGDCKSEDDEAFHGGFHSPRA